MSDLRVAVVIPTIPPREDLLARAVASVNAQTCKADQVVIWVDRDGIGAAAARNAALDEVDADFVAFLDDDDTLCRNHLQALTETQLKTGADLVYPRFGGINTHVFSPDLLGTPFTAAHAAHIRRVGNFIPITVLVRTEAIKAVGGFSPPPWASPDNPCEDWGCWIKLLDAGCTFVHHPAVTWTWERHSAGHSHTGGVSWKQARAYAG